MHTTGDKSYRVVVGPLVAALKSAINHGVPINVENFFAN
jgi:hypothetical protein